MVFKKPMGSRRSRSGDMGRGKRFEYDRMVGRWWLSRAANRAHQRAYDKIADFVGDSFPRAPGLIVDYACGDGNLLVRLGARFPRSGLVGLDGSNLLLDIARQRLERAGHSLISRTRLIETPLPNFHLLRGQADLVVFSFPNMMPFTTKTELSGNELLLEEDDRTVARSLARAQDLECEDPPSDPRAVRSTLIQGRMIALNMRRFLRKGGTCVRVEYGRARRSELSRLELLRVSFEEASLDVPVDGRRPGQWFRVIASSYCRSRVVEDVYQQTADERDKAGGYVITVLRAL